jgi:hypothetical protein
MNDEWSVLGKGLFTPGGKIIPATINKVEAGFGKQDKLLGLRNFRLIF